MRPDANISETIDGAQVCLDRIKAGWPGQKSPQRRKDTARALYDGPAKRLMDEASRIHDAVEQVLADAEREIAGAGTAAPEAIRCPHCNRPFIFDHGDFRECEDCGAEVPCPDSPCPDCERMRRVLA